MIRFYKSLYPVGYVNNTIRINQCSFGYSKIMLGYLVYERFKGFLLLKNYHTEFWMKI